MKIIKVEFKEETSRGIYCDMTYKNFFGKIKTRELFLDKYSKGSYSNIPKWSDTGIDLGIGLSLFYYQNVVEQMIRAYERTLK